MACTKKLFLLSIFIITTISIFTTVNNSSIGTESTDYNSEKLSYKVKSRFDRYSILNNKEFLFYRGTRQILQDEFISLTADTTLIENKKHQDEAKKVGLGLAIGFGVTGVIFLIPTIVYLNSKINVPIFTEPYTATGLAMLALTLFSFTSVIVDLFIMSAVVYYYRNDEKSIRSAIDKYNEQLAVKYKLIPDISFDNSSQLNFTASIRF